MMYNNSTWHFLLIQKLVFTTTVYFVDTLHLTSITDFANVFPKSCLFYHARCFLFFAVHHPHNRHLIKNQALILLSNYFNVFLNYKKGGEVIRKWHIWTLRCTTFSALNVLLTIFYSLSSPPVLLMVTHTLHPLFIDRHMRYMWQLMSIHTDHKRIFHLLVRSMRPFKSFFKQTDGNKLFIKA